jgi:hypothetical protein
VVQRFAQSGTGVSRLISASKKYRDLVKNINDRNNINLVKSPTVSNKQTSVTPKPTTTA